MATQVKTLKTKIVLDSRQKELVIIALEAMNNSMLRIMGNDYSGNADRDEIIALLKNN
jgi:hypothetical protein